MRTSQNLLANQDLAQKAAIYVQAIRPQMVVLPFGVFAAVVTASVGWQPVELVLGLVFLTCAYGIVTLQNDIADQHIDKLNKRADIPLAAGRMNAHEALRYMMWLLAIAICTAVLLTPHSLLWLAGYNVMGWLYSGPLQLKNNGYLAPAILALCYGVSPWLLAMIVTGGAWPPILLPCIVASFLFVYGIISFKDFKDVKGDRAGGKRTLLVLHGPGVVQRVAQGLVVAAMGVVAAATWGTLWPWAACTGAIAGYAVLARKDILVSGEARRRWVGGLRLFFLTFLVVVFVALRS
jgi:4-hydroxybenzoate polyprenyltransferase